MMTVKEIQKIIEYKFAKAGVDSPAFDSLCLIEKVLNVNQTKLITMHNHPISEKEIQALYAFTHRRINGEPLQYIIGKWSFYGYDLMVGEGVLIPRDDTEVVLSCALEYLKGKSRPKVLDLCSGSGALAIAIQKETNADVVAIEKSGKALPYLIENTKLNDAKVKIIQDDIFTCMDKFENHSFDLIISNPPYIKTNDISSLQKEIAYEPTMALDGGIDGYDFYRHIIEHWCCKLKQQGCLALELGEKQFDTVKELMEQRNFTNIKSKLDLSNVKRAIYGTVNDF